MISDAAPPRGADADPTGPIVPGGAPTRPLPRRITVAILILLAVMISLARLHTYNEPLERDITTYAVIGHELLAGRKLYSDMWDHKPPAVHLTYAAAEALVGYGPREVYLLNVLAGIATLLGVFAAARAGGASRSVALWAAAFWTVISGDLALHANQPETEAFVNACLIWALAAMLGLRGGTRERGRLALAGGLFAVASLYKPVAVVVAATLALAYVVWPPGERPDRRRAIRQALALSVPGAVAWLGTLAWFWLSGALGDFVAAVFSYNRDYGGDTGENLLLALSPGRLIPPAAISAVLPLAVTAAMMIAVVRAVRYRRAGWFALAYAIGAFVAVAFPGRFYPHYFQIWLPLLAVVGAWGLAALQEAAMPGRPWLVHAGAAAVLAMLVAAQAPSYRLSADEWSARKYGPRFVKARDNGVAVARLLAPGETFYEWGAETGLYFYSQRRPPTGVIYNYPLLFGPLIEPLSTRVLRDLTTHPPELVLIARANPMPMRQPGMEWVASHYAPISAPGIGPEMLCLARVGGALEARLHAARAPARD